jgi:hypothetical protein
MEPDRDENFKKMKVNVLAFDREYKIFYDTTNEKFYNKFISTFEKKLNTFTISDPSFEGIMC